MNPLGHTLDFTEAEHPSIEQLNAFAIGQLTDDDSLEVEQHLAVCASCSRVLETSPDDAFVSLLQLGDSLLQTGDSSAVAPSRSLRLVPG